MCKTLSLIRLPSTHTSLQLILQSEQNATVFRGNAVSDMQLLPYRPGRMTLFFQDGANRSSLPSGRGQGKVMEMALPGLGTLGPMECPYRTDANSNTAVQQAAGVERQFGILPPQQAQPAEQLGAEQSVPPGQTTVAEAQGGDADLPQIVDFDANQPAYVSAEQSQTSSF
eukprot:gnl/TRDRNA2_/TRDRNA2_157246_c1_seq1.p1 gnl/TRDRNA2_/TRDRNA2_157246_c1~~gnl/TRDRNA2_/TRDRNA2_157246_c1_seq1.p1  ORF type:complete len:198 (+),score=13.77 gnl/TRDRNA2_/TRDRNA2_157246_c1_seq1:87-596(+)